MKKLILTVLVIGTTCGSSFAKPGGWFKDLMNNSSFSISSSSGYYAPQQTYYQPAPVYYHPAPVVVYEQPRYYYQPQYVPVQPAYRSGSSFSWQGKNYHRHCR